jgi:hypothetical protein
MSDDTDVLEWHRVDAAILGSLALGTTVLFLGPVCGAFALIAFRHNLALEVALLLLGGACVLFGPTFAILRLVRSLHEDASLAARTDGVIFERNGKSLHMKWDDIERVDFEPVTTLIFRLRDDEPFVLHERFATIDVKELAKRLEDLRRKASFGLIAQKT